MWLSILFFLHAELSSETEKGDFLLWKILSHFSVRRPDFFLHYTILSQVPNFQWPLNLCKYMYPKWTDQLGVRAIASRGARGAGGGGGGGGAPPPPPPPPGPVKPDTSSLWMELFSLDSVILIIETCNLLFAIFAFEVDFSETYLITFKNFLGEDTPGPLYEALAFRCSR